MAGGFDSLGLMPELVRAVDELGWHLPTDVQDEAIPLILGGGDVMAAAETGSGKTAAFCLPMIQCVHERLRDSANAGGEGGVKMDTGPPDVRISDNDKDNIVTVTANGLSASSVAEKQWAGARATHGVRGGKCFFEVIVKSSGICRVGFSTMAAHHELGRDSHGIGYGGTGMKSFNNNFEPFGEKYGEGDTIGCAIDLSENDVDGDGEKESSEPATHSKGSLTFFKNGAMLGQPLVLPESMRGAVLFPAFVLKGCSIDINFGAAAFRYSVPTGYSSFLAAHPEDLVSSSAKEAFTTIGKRHPLAIILEPARDLAEQVFQAVLDMTRYISSPELKTLLIVGGDDSKKIQKTLKAGVDIVVGTTGKVIDMHKSGLLNLSQIKFFILDEADRLIETDNRPSIMQLYNACPGGGSGENRLQVCFFSATLHSPAITDLAAKLCVNPTWVDLKGIDSVPETVHHVIYRVDLEHDKHLLEGSKTAAVCDGIHDPLLQLKSERDKDSQRIKEIKMQVLVGIIDKFKVSLNGSEELCVSVFFLLLFSSLASLLLFSHCISLFSDYFVRPTHFRCLNA